MSGNQGETKSGLVAPAVVIPQLNQAQSRALARGRTIGHYGHGVQPNPFTLRQRAVYEDEGPRWNDGGGALFTARTRGVLRGIHEVGQHRAAVRPIIKAIGRQNVHFGRLHNPHTKLPSRMGAKGSTTQIPTFLTKRILEHEQPISDLTKTSLGAPSKRKGKTRKGPRTRGGRRGKRRKGGLNLSGCGEGKVRTRYGCGMRWNANPFSNPLGCCREVGAMPSFWGGRRKKTRRKLKRKRKRRKFKKGTKSKTHKGKDFETRKTSKNYNSKRWKRMTGRRTRKAPLFPFV